MQLRYAFYAYTQLFLRYSTVGRVTFFNVGYIIFIENSVTFPDKVLYSSMPVRHIITPFLRCKYTTFYKLPDPHSYPCIHIRTDWYKICQFVRINLCKHLHFKAKFRIFVVI